MKKTLGGDRIGAGEKMEVEIKEFPYSTHSLSYIRRTTAAPGVVIPILNQVGLPQDTWKIKFNVEGLTQPAVGPLFGSFIIDIHAFSAPWRLYIGDLHQNLLEQGNDMSLVKIPQVRLRAPRAASAIMKQIEPSSLFAQLDIMGLGRATGGTTGLFYRDFNALPFISYYDICKVFYANKQETDAFIVHTPVPTINQTVTSVTVSNNGETPVAVPAAPLVGSVGMEWNVNMDVTFSGTPPAVDTLYVTIDGIQYPMLGVFSSYRIDVANHYIFGNINTQFTYKYVQNWGYTGAAVPTQGQVTLTSFPLKNIDTMRINLLKQTGLPNGLLITSVSDLAPYSTVLEENQTDARTSLQYSLEGLFLKTYQSDLFNNWLKTSWVASITSRSSVNVTGGYLTMDALNNAKKVYEYLNTVAVAGGTYDDWMETVWGAQALNYTTSPTYIGGLRKVLAFQEVISTTGTTGEQGAPLGTLAGRGVMTNTHKGGEITHKVKELSTLMAMISITPRIDYSQGNKWDTNLKAVDDVHKPQFDGIGFQDLIMDQMAYFSTDVGNSGTVTFKMAGKQPAFINYMTMVNQNRGNFAAPDNMMYMVLDRRYKYSATTGIADMTTYIDPAKFNYIFADTRLDAQNFLLHIGIEMEVRREMSAKIMPNF